MSTPTPPGPVWETLAPLIAAPGRARMRVWSAETDKFSLTRPLRATLPTRPAAVYLYAKHRTRLLAMDFDTKRGGQAAVDADLAQALAWITACGGVAVTDRSTSGGRHLLVPLAIGTSATFDDITALMRLFAARLPTLDINPNLGATEGCLTPPGSPCKQGGYRQLDGPLEVAREAFTTRSAPDLLPRLYVLFGALGPRPTATGTPADPGYTVGDGDQRRLAPGFIRHDPLPGAVHDFATRGILDATDRHWPTPSEARMSVITHAAWRGYSLAAITALIGPGRPWEHGLGAAYQRYHHHAEAALSRDFTKALAWLAANPLRHRPPQHKITYPQGGSTGSKGSPALRAWLTQAYAWADREFAGQRYRWTVHTVLQALAVMAARAGQLVNGTPVVGVGGRNLSLACGLLSPDTVWRVLRDVREREGSPVTQIRSHLHLDPDVYALTSQNTITGPDTRMQRVRVEEVHPAWSVLGHHHRRVYELITQHGLTGTADVYAAARIAPSTGDAAVGALARAGLLARTGRGTVGAGPVSLDDIAAAHHTDEIREARITEYRAERRAWRDWLEDREAQRAVGATASATGWPATPPPGQHDPVVERAYLESVLATGPPDGADGTYSAELAAIELLAQLLGARLIAV